MRPAAAVTTASENTNPIQVAGQQRSASPNLMEPCSTETSSNSLSNRTNRQNSLVFIQAQADSALRQALAAASSTPPVLTTSTVTPSTSTPLLTASLNSPPVAHASHSNSPSPVPTSNFVATFNGSVDLSLGCRQKLQSTSPSTSPTSIREEDANNNSSSKNMATAEMYTNLLMQLRQTSATTSTGSSSTTSCTTSTRSSPATRKEKSKGQAASFQCPACKKKFQRHIAMNAHFQNEHIGQVQNDKICRLCSHRCKSIAGIRAHLIKSHHIDLDKPSSCLAEPEIKAKNGSSSRDLEMPRKASPEPGGGLLIEIKKEPEVGGGGGGGEPHGKFLQDHQLGEVMAMPKDLSVRCRSNPPDFVFQDRTAVLGNAAGPPVKRSSSPAATMATAGKRAKKNGNGPDPSSEASWKCSDCIIVFPNQTLYFLHRGFHSESNPWRCNGCGHTCSDMYDFNTHLVSVSHL